MAKKVVKSKAGKAAPAKAVKKAPAKAAPKKVVAKAAKPKAKPAAKPAVKSAAKPKAKAAPAKPLAKGKGAKSAPKPAAKAVKVAPKAAAKPVAKGKAVASKAKTVVKSTPKPAGKVASKPAKAVAKPVTKTPAKPLAKVEKSKPAKPVKAQIASKKAPAPAPAKALSRDELIKANKIPVEKSFPARKEKEPKPAKTGDEYEELTSSFQVSDQRNQNTIQPAIIGKTKFNDEELKEFKELILKKLNLAYTDYELLKDTLSQKDNNGTDDTSPTFKLLEDGSEVMSKEETTQLAIRQEKYIQNLKNALVRIENKTYGICKATGQMISKERLRIVPHATLSIEAKKKQG